VIDGVVLLLLLLLCRRLETIRVRRRCLPLQLSAAEVPTTEP